VAMLYTFIFLTVRDTAQQNTRNVAFKWQPIREFATMLRYMHASTYSARLWTKL